MLGQAIGIILLDTHGRDRGSRQLGTGVEKRLTAMIAWDTILETKEFIAEELYDFNI